MRPQTVALIAAGVITAAFFMVGIPIVMFWQMRMEPRVQPNFAPVGVPNPPPVAQNNVFDFVAPAAPHFIAGIEQPCTRENLASVRGELVQPRDYQLSEPHMHGNLAIFLVRGPDTVKDPNILTLQEALEQNLATVHDHQTGQLTIDNRSNAALFIQSGDIVKGGIQDRVLPYDLLISANTTRQPMTCLCVEAGRSAPRGAEMSRSFALANEQLPGKRLKLAAYRQSQNDVWSNVKRLQDNLSRNIGARVESPLSQTSLQLTLENERVSDAIQDYMAALAPVVEGKPDVIGYVVAVNGKIHTADVYGSSTLFQKLWPKLVRASSIEALAEQTGGAMEAPTVDAVRAFFSNAEQGQAFRRDVASRTVMLRQETEQALLYDTCDPTQQNVVVHRSLVTR